MKKFIFDFNDYDDSYSKLEEFICISIQLDVEYYTVLFSSDCKVLCGGPCIGTPIVTKFVFCDSEIGTKVFIDYIDYILRDWYSKYTGFCDCTVFSCFNVIHLYFIKCEGVDLQDITHKVKCYEGINYVK